jgi:Tfp pilus assembly protein PilF
MKTAFRLAFVMPGLLVGVVSYGLLWEHSVRASEPAEPITYSLADSLEDSLEDLGIHVTTGAASGYVDDRLCGRCHSDLARTYRDVGMARSFFRPRPATEIEDFQHGRFIHQRSGNTYEMKRHGERYFFKRFQEDTTGQAINVFEIEIDWILGSGAHARTYLYQGANGELYQLPISWYPQSNSWGMAPGYDNPRHSGVLRPVRRECMFCHNAYPEVPAKSDMYGTPHDFPFDLPEGIGCQRCHGPGAEHVRLSLGADNPLEAVRSSITNPGRLAPKLRNDICYGCHMQPSVALAGVRRFNRGDYSFRPGESLDDYLVQIDVTEEGKAQSERFEINHHPYRLEQSRCFIESQGELSCLTCHDPHRKIPPAERATHYRAACLSCHRLEACQKEAMVEGVPGQELEPENCVSCHMPARRTQDVVHVTMTDHFIRRQPGGPELLAPLEESTPTITDVHLTTLWQDEESSLAEVYRTVAVLRAGGGNNAVVHLEKQLAKSGLREVEPWLRLLPKQLQNRRVEEARATLDRIHKIAPEHPLAKQWSAPVYAALGQNAAALNAAREAAAGAPRNAESRFNLGRLLSSYGHHGEATLHLRRATELRPNFAPAWFHLGNAHLAFSQAKPAVAAYRRCLEIDPNHSTSYVQIAEALLTLGQRSEALRFLRHGITAARQPEPIQTALGKLGD